AGPRRDLAAEDVAAAAALRCGRGDQREIEAFHATTRAQQRFERAESGEAAQAPLRRRDRLGQTTVRLLRPLARRADSTLRPPTEDMRARKPWLRARRILEGWNVRFMAGLGWSSLSLEKPYIRARYRAFCQDAAGNVPPMRAVTTGRGRTDPLGRKNNSHEALSAVDNCRERV